MVKQKKESLLKWEWQVVKFMPHSNKTFKRIMTPAGFGFHYDLTYSNLIAIWKWVASGNKDNR